MIVNVEPVIVPDNPVIFAPVIKLNVGSVVLNCHPAGAVSTKTSVPGPNRSAAFPSVMVIVPSVVKAGAVLPAALLLQIPVPPLAGVTVTAAYPSP